MNATLGRNGDRMKIPVHVTPVHGACCRPLTLAPIAIRCDCMHLNMRCGGRSGNGHRPPSKKSADKPIPLSTMRLSFRRGGALQGTRVSYRSVWTRGSIARPALTGLTFLFEAVQVRKCKTGVFAESGANFEGVTIAVPTAQDQDKPPKSASQSPTVRDQNGSGIQVVWFAADVALRHVHGVLHGVLFPTKIREHVSGRKRECQRLCA